MQDSTPKEALQSKLADVLPSTRGPTEAKEPWCGRIGDVVGAKSVSEFDTSSVAMQSAKNTPRYPEKC